MSVLSFLLIFDVTQHSTGCSDEFHVVFEHFQNRESLILNILNEELHISCLVGSFFLKIV